MKKRILVITPRFPFAGKGACEQDRAWGIKRLVELGYEVEVITKCLPGDLKEVTDAENFCGAKIHPILYTTYKNYTQKEKIVRLCKRFLNPIFIDGAAYEYTDPEIQTKVKELVGSFKPDIAWIDYTYLWPIYKEIRKQKIPIVCRSINVEPIHFLEEDGRTLTNYLKFLPKLVSEYFSVAWADVAFSITPKEEIFYAKYTKTPVVNLPLRGLPRLIKTNHPIRSGEPLHVFFMGSTYNVVHNREALLFIIKDIAPLMKENHPGKFVFHIIGSKVPTDYTHYFNDEVLYEGPKYGADLETFLEKMDIALIPSLMGAGMQQKIFEPLCRGIPLLTSERGIAEYPFSKDVHYAAGTTKESFVEELIKLQSTDVRKSMSEASMKKSADIFSEQKIDIIVEQALRNVIK